MDFAPKKEGPKIQKYRSLFDFRFTRFAVGLWSAAPLFLAFQKMSVGQLGGFFNRNLITNSCWFEFAGVSEASPTVCLTKAVWSVVCRSKCTPIESASINYSKGRNEIQIMIIIWSTNTACGKQGVSHSLSLSNSACPLSFNRTTGKKCKTIKSKMVKRGTVLWRQAWWWHLPVIVTLASTRPVHVSNRLSIECLPTQPDCQFPPPPLGPLFYQTSQGILIETRDKVKLRD